ncbi:hypothetical protein BDIM_23470 [Brevundimonas diminuta ATCC 11568]|nr:hypothetical protein BDIM_23470 [Brevundimonas diminuta ATCC 11568]
MIDIVSFIAIAWAAPPRVPGRRADRAPPPSVVLNGKLHLLRPRRARKRAETARSRIANKR